MHIADRLKYQKTKKQNAREDPSCPGNIGMYIATIVLNRTWYRFTHFKCFLMLTTISFVTSVRPFVRRGQLGSHWTYFD